MRIVYTQFLANYIYYSIRALKEQSMNMFKSRRKMTELKLQQTEGRQ